MRYIIYLKKYYVNFCKNFKSTRGVRPMGVKTYSKAEIAQAKAVPLVDLIKSRGIEAKKQGSNFLCLCPFHSDTAPSLSINPAKNLFNCFGCGVGGDSIVFVQKYDKLPFNKAVALLLGETEEVRSMKCEVGSQKVDPNSFTATESEGAQREERNNYELEIDDFPLNRIT